MPVILPELLHAINKAVSISGAPHHIYLKLFHILRMHLRIAAADADHRFRVQLSGPSQCIPGLFITDRSDRAGIDDIKVTGLVKPSRGIAPGDQIFFQRLRFVLVDLASQGVDGKLHGNSPLHVFVFVVYSSCNSAIGGILLFYYIG